MQKSDRAIVQDLKLQLTILGGLTALCWVIQLVNVLLPGLKLDLFGVIPRFPLGLRGVIFAPFLHASWGHLIGNTIPFWGLGWLVMLRRTEDFWLVSGLAALASGVGTWLIGQNGVHIGASGVVFGYLGYLLLRGYFERRPVAIALSVFVMVIYGGLLGGVLPIQTGISWEGHLFGFLGGVMAAKLLAQPRQQVL
jgi:membrane associated rhomboid family serine protease